MRRQRMKRIPIEPQELANRHEAWLARDKSGYAYLHDSRPVLRDGECWRGDGNFCSASTLYDIQWPKEQDYRDSLYEPELEILPCPRGGEVELAEFWGEWRVCSETSGKPGLLNVGYFLTRAEAIRAWNAVVREVTNSSRAE
jgi:hypothetical protein